MSDYDRGRPTEPPLSFDPRRPVRGAGPVPVTLIVSALVLVALVGAVAFIYRGGIRHANQAPAVVGAPLGDIKAAAPPEAPSNDATAGLVIEKTDANGEAANAVLAPPPEQPLPRTGSVPVVAAPPPAPIVTAKPVTELPVTPAPVKLATATPVKKPPTIAGLADATTGAKKPPKPLAAAAAPPAAGAGWVQIGAFSSPALAEKGWNDIARLAPAAMAGKGKKVETVSKDGTDLYRTYITGFPTRAAAQGFCDKLKAAGKSCFVK